MFLSVAAAPLWAQEDVSPAGLRVVVLGTGTPNADPERWGPAVAVLYGERSFIVDAGVGVVRRAAAAAERHGAPALEPPRLNRVFLTHLHSDHTLGLPDVILSPWVLDRPDGIQVVGPPGTREMVRNIMAAWRSDIDMRLYGLEPREANPDAYRAEVAETRGGVVYDEEGLRVTAIPVLHGSWPHALGFRFEAGGRVIVISGDARPSETLVEACSGCDVLVHEVYSARTFQGRPPEWRRYHASSHTSTEELARLAGRAQPGTLVLYHQLFWGASDADLVREVQEAGYLGEVRSAADLEMYR
ncbi:MAG: MBL fold metallo-hydrolase [Gemmatimonadota bacterium]|nr:MBL fold metallo-hydrolase [Gemmatimonadota bacterium]